MESILDQKNEKGTVKRLSASHACKASLVLLAGLCLALQAFFAPRRCRARAIDVRGRRADMVRIEPTTLWDANEAYFIAAMKEAHISRTAAADVFPGVLPKIVQLRTAEAAICALFFCAGVALRWDARPLRVGKLGFVFGCTLLTLD
mmetsp:Transcript_41135/g.61643  ORF Transcript_41135/g.61643 Transcript_41135/m.61643 type:complete len:147 (-) Transcript_41135:123-563(-)